MSSAAYPSYPYGYLYPNEFAEPVVWLPTIFAYALLIAGAGLLILALAAYLFNRMARHVPLLLVLGISLFAPVLLGPLSDLRAPDRGYMMMLSPRIFPTEGNPGVSIIALIGALAWPLGLVLAGLFTLLYFSYPMYKKYLAARSAASAAKRAMSTLYLVLSMGVRAESSYERLRPALKILAAAALIPLALWSVYPATLLQFQTRLFAWAEWPLLVPTWFADTFVLAAASAMLAYWAVNVGRAEKKDLAPLLAILAAASAAAASLLALQWWSWYSVWGGSPFSQSLAPLVPLLYAAMGLLFAAFVASLASLRFSRLSLLPPLIGIIGASLNKWNVVVNGQMTSRTGLGLLPPVELTPHLVGEVASIVAAGVFVFIVLSSIFPLGGGDHEAH